MDLKLTIVCLVVISCNEGNSAERGTVIDLHESSGRQKRNANDIRINNFVINSTESLRFAKVNITSSVENLANEDKEFNFRIRIPNSAFISGFVLKIGDVETRAIVAEKAAAMKTFTDAKEQNVTAGHVTQQTTVADDKDRDIFDISVNIAKQTTVEFRLQYYEFLERHARVYTQTFYIYPLNVVHNLQIFTDYTERQDFTKFSYKVPFADDGSVSVQERPVSDGYYGRKLEWLPSSLDAEIDDQTEDEAFEVTYELESLDNGGHVIYNDNGDFAHYFSTVCNDSHILPKKIIFVIDISGSMQGVAIEQVRIAIGLILDKLRFTDYFNIILFEMNVHVYSQSFVLATYSNVLLAKAYVADKVKPRGSTNMNEALLTAARMIKAEATSNDEGYVNTIVFLTDGAPTTGVTNRNTIRDNLKSVNYIDGKECCHSSFYTIAFSKTPAIEFLRRLTDDHLGTLRVVREQSGSDIGQELVDIYTEIHNPYFKNVQFSFYSDGEVVSEDDVTQSFFLQYDCGGELVVGGQTKPGVVVEPRVQVDGYNERLLMTTIPALPSREVSSDLLARLVAYKKVKELLKIATLSTDRTQIEQANAKALELSLKMEFVTSVTSLVVALFPPPPENTVTGDPPPLRGIGPFQDTNFNLNRRGQVNDYTSDLGEVISDIEEELFPENTAYQMYTAKFLIHILVCITQIL